MKYRNRTEIIARILETASGSGITKTKIMYNSLLSYPQLKEYLSLVLEKGLIEYQEEKRTYKTTYKGMRFLEIYNELNELITTLKQNKKAW
jgi:predicted transcriptional regulator